MAWDTAETRRRIKRAATAEFAQYGPDGTAIERIAKRAGVNKERVYNYFGDKRALFAAVLRDELAEVARSVPVESFAAEDIGDYAGRVYDYHRERPELIRLLRWEALSYDGEVPDEHGRNRNRKGVRAVQGRAGGIGEKNGLDAELQRGAQSGAVDADVCADACGDELALQVGGAAADERVDAVAHERHDDGHVEAVGAQGQNAAVAEEHGLDDERDGYRDRGGPGAEQHGDQRRADGMARRSARNGNIEHHGEEAERRRDAEQGHLFARHRLAHLLDGESPNGDHYGAENAAGGRTQVVLWNMHGASLSGREGLAR